jgi:hypothetical protein
MTNKKTIKSTNKKTIKPARYEVIGMKIIRNGEETS